jgi:phosphoribosylformylglycinamidine synthase PurS subunit
MQSQSPPVPPPEADTLHIGMKPQGFTGRKSSPPDEAWPNILAHRPAGRSRQIMKAKIIITPKKAVLDPQGKTVQNALEHMGYQGVSAVHVGKYIEIDLAPGTDKETARQAIDEASHRFLSNPIIEDYRLEIE